jgi:hypothetical protein
LYQVIGKGTQWLSRREKGEDLDALGPLGNGFKMDPAVNDIVLVSGGIGIAPLYALADEILKTNPNAKVAILFGVRSQDQNFYEAECRRSGSLPLNDDGSNDLGYGHRALVDLLDRDGSNGSFTVAPEASARTGKGAGGSTFPSGNIGRAHGCGLAPAFLRFTKPPPSGRMINGRSIFFSGMRKEKPLRLMHGRSCF